MGLRAVKQSVRESIPRLSVPTTYSSLCHRELPEPIEAAGVL
jgi:hypothetical protein